MKLAFFRIAIFANFVHYIAKTFFILEFWNKHFSCVSVKFLKTYYALSSRSQVFLKIGVLRTWRTSTLLKRDSNTGVFLWILRNFKKQLFHRTPPLAASALNFILYFKLRLYNLKSLIVVYLRRYFISFICSFIFLIFSSHVGTLILIGSFSSN